MRTPALTMLAALLACIANAQPATATAAQAINTIDEISGTPVVLHVAEATPHATRRAGPCRPRYKRVCTPRYERRCIRPTYRLCVERCRPGHPSYNSCRSKCMSQHCRQVKVGEDCRRVQVGTTCDHLGDRDATGPVRPRPSPAR